MFKAQVMSWKDSVYTVLERDPAARSFQEALMFSPGLHAILFQKISNQQFKKGNFMLARAINYFARFLTGADIHPGATIGKGFFIDHATGVVIGETTIIGENVSMFQGVTLGGVSTSKGKRHPTIGNNVTIGAGAIVLGNITIGDSVKIGAGSVVTKDVPHNCTVVGVPGRVVRREGLPVVKTDLRHDDLPDPLRDAINNITGKISELDRRLALMEEQLKKQK
jgi:serine O-acetyltransferase